MGKRNRNLFDQIVDWDNMLSAYKKTSDGKKQSFGYLEFKEYDLANLRELRQELIDGTYVRGPYREFIIREPKPRLISALEFRDRLVQHALCNIITPIFERGFLPYSFACRVNLGTHAGVRHVQSMLRNTGCKYFLKTDFSKYFPSVDRMILRRMITKKIHCKRTLDLIDRILEPNGKGIPIGSLTSQLFANVYGNALDHFIHHELKQKHWARYMDDVVILGNEPNKLHHIFQKIVDFSRSAMQMAISKWQISQTSKGINFLGYRIWPTHKLIRKDSATRAKRKIAWLLRHNEPEKLSRFIASWRGHAQWADVNHLFTHLEKRYGIAV
jgi:retron-type reverse transcriptase